MLKSLFQESFGGLNAGIVESQAEEPGIFSMLAESVGSEFFGGVTPDGKAYSTFVVEDDAPIVGAKPKTAVPTNPLAAPQKPEVKPSGKPGALSAPEQTLSETEKVIGTIITTIASPLLMPIDALAIKADLIPTPDELLSQTLQDLSAAAQAYRQIPEIVANDPKRQQIIQEAAKTALKIAIPQPADDVMWEKPTTQENVIAIQQAYDLVKQAIAEIGDVKCPSCGQLPCCCGASEINFSLPDVMQRIKAITEQHNSRLALDAASNTVVNNVRRQAAGALKDAIGDKPVEVLHIPPKSLLTGAILGDWRQLVPAIVASVIENESGKRGASIALKPKPGTKEGGSLIVNMTEIGKGTDSDEFPLASPTTWEQTTLQQSLSDKRSNRNRWGRTKHGTVPEIGNLNIVSPGNSSIKQKIPVAVRFPHTDRDSQGGASVINFALSQLTGVQAFLKDAQSALATPDFGNDDHALTQSATVAATKSLEQDGIRPGVIARKTHEIVTKILEDQASSPTLTNIANQVHSARHQQYDALAKSQHDLSTLNLALTNLQNAIEYSQVLSTGQYLSNDKKDVYVRNKSTREVVPLSKVNAALAKKELPADWEVVILPTPEVNQAIIQTAVEEIQSLNPSPQLWRSALNGDIPLKGINRTTIARAMAHTAPPDDIRSKTGHNTQKTLGQRAADNIDLLFALISPRRKSK